MFQIGDQRFQIAVEALTAANLTASGYVCRLIEVDPKMNSTIRKSALWVLAISIVTSLVAPRSRAQSQDNAGPVFEVTSVKPGSPGFTGGPRVPDGDGTASFPACAGGLIQVD